MKNKLIEKIESIYKEIQTIENELDSKKLQLDSIEKLDRLEFGAKVLKIQQLNTELFTSLDIFLSLAEGKIDELDTKVAEYFNQVNSLKQPIQDSDSEDVKKLKEVINSLKDEKNLPDSK
jgi:uncharacterized protein YlzI (FlbEa/FlbD family)